MFRLARIGYQLAKLIPQQCMLCLRGCQQLPCTHCRDAIRQFPHKAFKHNLMRWPKVASALQLSEFECVHAIGEYEYPLTKLITDLKFNGKLACAEALSNCFCASLKERNLPLPQLILPAPLHHKRYVKRQFNQAVEIAVAVAERLKIRCDLAALNRHRYTLAQTELDRDQRLSNVAGAFSCNKLTRDITHIAIFDDVITTGATMCAMRDAVLETNPHIKIEVWSISIALASLD